MPAIIDLTGNVYGKLTVVGRDTSTVGKVRYMCRCSCGKEKSILSQHLKDGHSKSCGCAKPGAKPAKSAGVRIDLTGINFGRWHVEKYLGGGCYQCVCDCGTVKEVKALYLRSGESNSCGCWKAELSRQKLIDAGAHAQRMDLKDTTNGMLTYVGEIGDDEHGVRWISCQCACGKTYRMRANEYIRGLTKSCGCYRKQHGAMLGKVWGPRNLTGAK